MNFDASGAWQWARQRGTSSWGQSRGRALDSEGNAFLTVYAYGSLDGQSYLGSTDILLMKFDASGAGSGRGSGALRVGTSPAA